MPSDSECAMGLNGQTQAVLKACAKEKQKIDKNSD